MTILGISCFYHDSAAALIIDGKVVAAAQEERFSRRKHDSDFPRQAIAFCLSHAGITMQDVEVVAFYEKPLLKFERLLHSYIHTWPKGLVSFVKAMGSWTKTKLRVEHVIRSELSYPGQILYVEHHYAHAASAFYCSHFEEAAILTMDGVGEWDTTTVGLGSRNQISLSRAVTFPHSLGLLYSAVTGYLGFAVNSDEYKIMGLAPYGDPSIYRDKFKELIKIYDDGSFRLDMQYFSYEYGLRMTSRAFTALFGGPPRKKDEPITKREMDIAAALQATLEQAVVALAAHAKHITNSPNLCLAGGVALNCVANGKLLSSALFENIYIHPAAGDAGAAIGAALYVYFDVQKNPRIMDVMQSPFLGPSYENEEIRALLQRASADSAIAQHFSFRELEDDPLLDETAHALVGENAVGWFQGRMEWGPRALGNRSILADPRIKDNWQKINRKIKFRESFRPLAPSVLADHAGDYFGLKKESPFMLLVANVLSNSIPAVTHVDGTARIQTVTKELNQKFYELLEHFYKKTGCAVLINTSMNVRDEPIVMSPEDALQCFLKTDMDYLVIGNFFLKKEAAHAAIERSASNRAPI